MVNCFVPFCSHRSDKSPNHQCKMIRFPKDAKLRAKWIKAIRRADKEPGDNSRVCSCHFPEGNKTNRPSIFPWNENKLFCFKSLDKKRRRQSGTESSLISQPSINVEALFHPSPKAKPKIGDNGEAMKSIQIVPIQSVPNEANTSKVESHFYPNLNRSQSGTESSLISQRSINVEALFHPGPKPKPKPKIGDNDEAMKSIQIVPIQSVPNEADTLRVESHFHPNLSISDNDETTKSTQTIPSTYEVELTLMKDKISQLEKEVENLKKKPMVLLCTTHEYIV